MIRLQLVGTEDCSNSHLWWFKEVYFLFAADDKKRYKVLIICFRKKESDLPKGSNPGTPKPKAKSGKC